MKRIVLLLIIILSAFKVNSQSIIEMEYKNGVYYVPCKIKDIPMNFIFDTGASNVSISLTEAMFLLKHGAISTKNIGATTKYQIANGKIQEGTKVIIPSIKVGGFELNNIEAGIVHNMEAPLLLGQSAISKLGKVQLDGNKLIIQKESNKENKFLGININNHFDDFNLGIRFKDYVLKAKKEGSINSSGIIKQSFKVQDLTHKNHSLSFMNFQESIFFHESGYIYTIVLNKTPNDINKDYNKVINFIDLNISVSKKEGKENITEWGNEYYHLVLGKQDETNKLGLVLGNKNFIKIGENKTDYKKTSYFLNVDFDKEFNDYNLGYSLDKLNSWARDKSLILQDGEIKKYYDSTVFNKNQNNFLDVFGFNEKLITFNRKGFIHSYYLIKKTEVPEKKFLEVAKEITKRYGKFKIINGKNIYWNSNNKYVIYLSEFKDRILIVCTNTLLLNNLNKK
ncbi:retropepsin-like aspartic protease [Tenacibaculum maritimum]|uniref:retropepsin-like aspartic protease family protein n=3 Tax=Tenacibaculum maritimum TaxID=107401 RepID=UPI0012E47780|nr:retropepsin-like aspartic protease [Tenacibaculum maritimum]CAA0228011.1 hypothetical protein DPIF89300162_510017 [Tenacibaculum maritimum]